MVVVSITIDNSWTITSDTITSPVLLLLVPEYYHKRTMIVASIYPAGGRGLHRGRSQFGSKPVPVNTQPTSQANLSEIEKEKSTKVN